jgi:hypothetical protein
MGYRGRRVDDNQTDLVKVFRALGCTVEPRLSQLGKGVPDLLVSKDGWTVVVEVKDGAKPTSERRLTDKEAEWKTTWQGAYAVIESPSQAYDMVADMTLKMALRPSKGCCGACSCRAGSGG